MRLALGVNTFLATICAFCAGVQGMWKVAGIFTFLLLLAKKSKVCENTAFMQLGARCYALQHSVEECQGDKEQLSVYVASAFWMIRGNWFPHFLHSTQQTVKTLDSRLPDASSTTSSCNCLSGDKNEACSIIFPPYAASAPGRLPDVCPVFIYSEKSLRLHFY